jgi:hypothetical protein
VVHCRGEEDAVRHRRRWVLGGIAAVALVPFALWSNGLQGVGPWGDQLGYRTSWINPISYSTSKEAPLTLTVLFPWAEKGYCGGQFSVQVRETQTSVLVEQVKSQAPKGMCADMAGGGVISVSAILLRPLGTRSVLRVSDQQPLSYVPNPSAP